MLLHQYQRKESDSFFKFFPPPRFLEMSAAGLDISNKSVKFLEFKKTSEGLRIDKYGRENIPAGTISGGEIKNKETLIEVLKKMKNRHNLHFIRLSLPEEKAYIYHTVVPREAAGNIKEAASFTLEENVPVSSNEIIFDADVMEENDHNHIDITVSAFPRSNIESYVSVCKEAGLEPLSMEIEAEAVARAVLPEGDRGTYLVLDFGATRSSLFVASHGSVHFTATLEIGGDMLTKTVEKFSGLPYEEAEKLKRQAGFIKNKDNKDLFLALMGTVSALKDEINRYYVYWHTHVSKSGDRVDKIEKIIVCGGEANLPGLSEYLSSSLRIKVETANIWTNAFSLEDYIPEMPFEDSLGYATAAGLALRRT